MKTVTLEAAKANLDAVLEHSRQGGTVHIIDGDEAFELVRTYLPKKGRRKAGSAHGKFTTSDEFYEYLELVPYKE